MLRRQPAAWTNQGGMPPRNAECRNFTGPVDFALSIIPKTLVSAFTEGQVLQTLLGLTDQPDPDFAVVTP